MIEKQGLFSFMHLWVSANCHHPYFLLSQRVDHQTNHEGLSALENPKGLYLHQTSPGDGICLQPPQMNRRAYSAIDWGVKGFDSLSQHANLFREWAFSSLLHGRGLRLTWIIIIGAILIATASCLRFLINRYPTMQRNHVRVSRQTPIELRLLGKGTRSPSFQRIITPRNSQLCREKQVVAMPYHGITAFYHF